VFLDVLLFEYLQKIELEARRSAAPAGFFLLATFHPFMQWASVFILINQIFSLTASVV
jgi:hypothetical protein